MTMTRPARPPPTRLTQPPRCPGPSLPASHPPFRCTKKDCVGEPTATLACFEWRQEHSALWDFTAARSDASLRVRVGDAVQHAVLLHLPQWAPGPVALLLCLGFSPSPTLRSCIPKLPHGHGDSDQAPTKPGLLGDPQLAVPSTHSSQFRVHAATRWSSESISGHLTCT